MKSSITESERLQLLGLFMLATSFYRKMRQAEYLIAEMVESEDPHNAAHLSDALYDDNGGTVGHFDEALRKSQIAVIKDGNS